MADQTVPQPDRSSKPEPSREFDAGWLSGFFDAEGCVHITGHKRPFCTISASNTEPELIRACSERLSNFMVDHTIRIDRPGGRRKDTHSVRIIKLGSVVHFWNVSRLVTKRKFIALTRCAEYASNTHPEFRPLRNVTGGFTDEFRRGYYLRKFF